MRGTWGNTHNKRAILRYLIEQLECRQLLSGSGTQLIANVSTSLADTLQDPIEVGGKLFYTGYKSSNYGPDILFASDGVNTTPTTLLTSTYSGNDEFDGITALTAYHSKLYFFADTTAGEELYSSDGTTAGTQVVTALAGSQLPNQMVILNDKLLYFVTNINQALKMYLSDGTSVGTTLTWSGATGDSVSAMSDSVNSVVFFNASGGLWRTNGTLTGTKAVVSSFNDGLSAPADFQATASKVFFTRQGFNGTTDPPNTLYSMNYDGSNLTVITLPGTNNADASIDSYSGYTVVGNHVLFTNYANDGTYLFSTDGINADTVSLAGSSSMTAQNLETVGTGSTATFVLEQNTSSTTSELWSTDGTITGTQQLVPSVPTQGFYNSFSAVGEAFYMFDSTLRLLETNGTVSGTRVLQFPEFTGSIAPLPFGAFQQRFVMNVSNVLWSFDPNVATGSIGGSAFLDDNRNGVLDSTDRNLVGTVYLDLNNNGVWDSATELSVTYGNGPTDTSYLFDGLPVDTYTLRFIGYGTLSGVQITTPSNGAITVNLQANQNITNANFIAADNTVRGTVFYDTNKDGIEETQAPYYEGPETGATVYLDYNNNGYHDSNEPTASVDGTTGQYQFLNAAVGQYPVMRSDVAGNIQTTPVGRTGIMLNIDGSVGITNVAPFGITNTATGSVSGVVWDDWNHNGALDGGDVPMSGVSLYLDLNGDGVYNSSLDPTTTTNSTGQYTFSNYNPGQYLVGIVPVANQVQSSPASGGWTASVTAGGAATLPNFFVYKTNATAPGGMVYGHVFSDHNSNKVADANEPSAWGITVWIDANQNGLLDSNERRAVTDLQGNYSFPNSVAGTYRLVVSLPSGSTQTTPTTQPTTITLSTNQQYSVSDFGVHFQSSTPPTVQSSSLNMNAPPSLQLQMSEDVAGTVDPTDLVINSVANPAVNLAPLSAGFNEATNVATYVLPTNLADGNYVATLQANSVSDLAGDLLTNAATCNFFILAGDANHDRYVNALDFNALATSYGQSGKTYAQGDFNNNGTVDSSDFAILASQYGKYLSPPMNADVPESMSASATSVIAQSPNLFGNDPITAGSSLLNDASL